MWRDESTPRTVGELGHYSLNGLEKTNLLCFYFLIGKTGIPLWASPSFSVKPECGGVGGSKPMILLPSCDSGQATLPLHVLVLPLAQWAFYPSSLSGLPSSNGVNREESRH